MRLPASSMETHGFGQREVDAVVLTLVHLHVDITDEPANKDVRYRTAKFRGINILQDIIDVSPAIYRSAAYLVKH